MANGVAVDGTPTAPYLPWAAFKSFLQKLKETVIPPRIDGSVMQGMSGSTQSQMKTGLRFFHLIDASDQVRPSLKDLVAAFGTPEWPSALDKIVTQSYSDIVSGVDIERSTQGELRDAFRAKVGVQGSVLEKAVRFYLAALQESGKTLSPHFKAKAPSAGGADRSKRHGGERRKRARRAAEDSEKGAAEVELPEGTTRHPFKLPGRPDITLILPDDISVEEWSVLDAYMRSVIGLKSTRNK